MLRFPLVVDNQRPPKYIERGQLARVILGILLLIIVFGFLGFLFALKLTD